MFVKLRPRDLCGPVKYSAAKMTDMSKHEHFF